MFNVLSYLIDEVIITQKCLSLIYCTKYKINNYSLILNFNLYFLILTASLYSFVKRNTFNY